MSYFRVYFSRKSKRKLEPARAVFFCHKWIMQHKFKKKTLLSDQKQVMHFLLNNSNPITWDMTWLHILLLFIEQNSV